MRRAAVVMAAALAAVSVAGVERASAFCGFYVAKADTKLFNKASQVVLVRSGDRTVMTMANDFRGDPSEFALVVPVPEVLQRGQIHVGDPQVLAHLDAYTAPRLVEYHDEDPCRRMVMMESKMSVQAPMAAGAGKSRADALGVKIEARYTVGEYDILILSAKQSGGLETWLVENGYRIPPGASRVLGSYLKQGMKFFVAKVNLKEKKKLGFQNLRPLQMAYESRKFMLPIRLGMVNADGPQELFIYALTRKGRVETTNYRTVKLPTGMDIPVFVKEEFGEFYKAMFSQQVRREQMRAVFLEYAWDMNWCDPCAADPLSERELRQLGVWWVGRPANDPPDDDSYPMPGEGDDEGYPMPGDDEGYPMPGGGGGGTGYPMSRPQRVKAAPAPAPPMPGGAADVFVTRLHVRYDAAHFPEDLVFQETSDRENFQGRYVLRHPWLGKAECEDHRRYRRELAERRNKEAATLAELTGWRLSDIRRKMRLGGRVTPAAGDATTERPWYERVWD